ncbi:MAG: helix-turn-helix transcriptional regulator [Deltaproteobacteria bacterium]|nr:helix-turn-helix transcriptional regulator [Deltaproteobacteria bacterium]
MNILAGSTLKPKDEVERKILERIGRWTVRLLQHRQRTEDLISSDEVIAEDRTALGNIVGERLENARKVRQLTQEELASKSGLSQSTISRIESGEKLMSVTDARKLAPILKCSAKFLIAGEK